MSLLPPSVTIPVTLWVFLLCGGYFFLFDALILHQTSDSAPELLQPPLPVPLPLQMILKISSPSQ